LTNEHFDYVIYSSIEKRITGASDEFENMVRGFIKRKNKKSEFVYLISSKNGLTKIGIAKDVQSRLSSLNTASPIELSLLFYFNPKNARKAEEELHKRFSIKRVKGEWFNLSDGDISWIQKNYDTL